MSTKKVKTRIIQKHDLEVNWITASESQKPFIPEKGELIIYDIEVDADGNTLALPSGRTTPYTYQRFKIGDGINNVKNLPFAGSPSEHDIKLIEDLYTYVPIGKAQKASAEIIGSGSTISATNRGKLGEKGDSLKAVFNKIFGEQTDTQPTITTTDVKLTASAGTTAYGGGEYGTVVPEVKDLTITFTLNNKGTANYGYRCGNVKTTGSKNFYYPVTKQPIAEGSTTEADIVITLPSNQTAAKAMLTDQTLFVFAADNKLYCNFNSSKKVSIKINLPEGSVSTEAIERYGQISTEVKLGAAQTSDSLTANSNAVIDRFLTFLGADATNTSKLTGGTKTTTAGPYTISAGSYYNYWVTSTSTSLSNDIENPVTAATQYTSTSVNISCDEASHIWFLLPPGTTGSKSIQYEPFANTWVDAFGGDGDTTVGPVDVALELDSNAKVMYKGYYTSAKAGAGSSLNYKIVAK